MSDEFPQVWKRTTEEDDPVPHHVDVVWEDRTENFQKFKHSSPEGYDPRSLKSDFLDAESASLISAGEQIFTETEDADRAEYESTPYVIYDDLEGRDNLLTILYDSYMETYRLDTVYTGNDHVLNMGDPEAYYRGNGFNRVGVSIHMSPSRFGE